MRSIARFRPVWRRQRSDDQHGRGSVVPASGLGVLTAHHHRQCPTDGAGSSGQGRLIARLWDSGWGRRARNHPRKEKPADVVCDNGASAGLFRVWMVPLSRHKRNTPSVTRQSGPSGLLVPPARRTGPSRCRRPRCGGRPLRSGRGRVRCQRNSVRFGHTPLRSFRSP